MSGETGVSTQKEEWVRHIRVANLIERFDAVLYPVDVRALIDRLPTAGWVVPRQLDEEGVVEAKDIPSKGNSRLRLDMGNKTIGVAGNDLGETVANYRQLRELLAELMDVSPTWSTDYLEFRYIGWMRGKSSPVGVFARWWSGNERVSRLGSSLAHQLPSDAAFMSPYGIRFSPSGLDANRPNWSELTIIPETVAGNTRYHFDLLYRNQDGSITERVAESADDILEMTLHQLENP